MKLLRSADIFAAKPVWNVKGNKKSSSYLGLTFTTFLIGLFIWACYFYSYDMINKTNPQIAQAQLDGVTFETTMTLKSTEFPFAFGVIDSTTRTFYTDPTIFSIVAGLMDDYENITLLNTTLCQPDGLYQSGIFRGLKGNTSCFQDDSQLNIQGLKSNVFVQIVPCQNTSSIVCKSPAAIRQALNNVMFYTFYKVTTIQIRNYENVLINRWDYDTYSILPNLNKAISSFILTVQIDTDSGWMVPSIDTINVMNIEKTEIDISEIDIDGSVLNFIIYDSGRLHHFTRTYKKFENILAQVVSLMNVVILFFGLLTLPYARMKMYENVAREVFRIELDRRPARKKGLNLQKTNLDIDQSNIQSYEYSNGVYDITENLDQASKMKLEPNIVLDNGEDKLFNHSTYFPRKRGHTVGAQAENNCSNTSDKFVESYLEEIDEIRNNTLEKNSFQSFSYFEYIASLFRQNQKVEMIKKAQDVLKTRIDLVSIVKKCVEIDMLKHLILTKEQRILFENLDKPALYFSSLGKNKTMRGKSRIRMDNWVNFKHDPKALKLAYSTLKNKNEKSDIDLKLITRIEDQAYENKK